MLVVKNLSDHVGDARDMSPVPGLEEEDMIKFLFLKELPVNKFFSTTDTENRLIDTGRGEERVRCMGRVTWKLTLPYVK